MGGGPTDACAGRRAPHRADVGDRRRAAGAAGACSAPASPISASRGSCSPSIGTGWSATDSRGSSASPPPCCGRSASPSSTTARTRSRSPTRCSGRRDYARPGVQRTRTDDRSPRRSRSIGSTVGPARRSVDIFTAFDARREPRRASARARERGSSRHRFEWTRASGARGRWPTRSPPPVVCCSEARAPSTGGSISRCTSPGSPPRHPSPRSPTCRTGGRLRRSCDAVRAIPAFASRATRLPAELVLAGARRAARGAHARVEHDHDPAPRARRQRAACSGNGRPERVCTERALR